MKTPTHLARLVQEAPLTPPSPSSIQYPLNSTVHSALASSVWCELHTPRWQMGRALIAQAHWGLRLRLLLPQPDRAQAQRQEQQITEALRAPVCSRQTPPPVAELPAPPSPRRPARSPRVSQARVSCRENGGGYESSQEENRTHPTHGLSRGSETVSLSFPSGRLSLDSGV